jgi:hypothetical protein
VDENDVATIIIKAIDDPRTLSKQLVYRPKPNTLSMNEIVEIFEEKTGHNLEKTYIPGPVIRAQLDGKGMLMNLQYVCVCVCMYRSHVELLISSSKLVLTEVFILL